MCFIVFALKMTISSLNEIFAVKHLRNNLWTSQRWSSPRGMLIWVHSPTYSLLEFHYEFVYFQSFQNTNSPNLVWFKSSRNLRISWKRRSSGVPRINVRNRYVYSWKWCFPLFIFFKWVFQTNEVIRTVWNRIDIENTFVSHREVLEYLSRNIFLQEKQSSQSEMATLLASHPVSWSKIENIE